MATFAANRSLVISLNIRLISSSARKSSRPVRYIPKDYDAPPSETSGKKEAGLVGKRALHRGMGDRKLTNFGDREYQNSLFDAGTIRSSDTLDHVEEFPELEDANSSALDFVHADITSNFLPLPDEIFDPDGSKITEKRGVISSKIREDAEKMAIELLAGRSFTAVELQKKLRGKKYPLNVVESVIADIKHRGLLNDDLYAESFSRSRWLSSTWGPRRIKQALVQKGVDGAVADKALEHVFDGDDHCGDSHSLHHGMSKPSLDRLFVQASKQWLRGQNATLENRKARMVRWLQYRGFDWGVTNFILKKLQALHPP